MVRDDSGTMRKQAAEDSSKIGERPLMTYEESFAMWDDSICQVGDDRSICSQLEKIRLDLWGPGASHQVVGLWHAVALHIFSERPKE